MSLTPKLGERGRFAKVSKYMVGVAQSVEHQVVALGVEGSSPFTHPIFMIPLQNALNILKRYIILRP